MAGNAQIPDLASVLRTLASLTPTNAQQQGQDTAAASALPPYDPTHPIQPGLQSSGNAGLPPIQATKTVNEHGTIPQHRPSIQDPLRNKSAPPLIDPATITEWSHGLRCVSKIATQNPHFKMAIRKLIADQEQQEKTWWAEREAMLKIHASRSSNDENLQSILSSLGSSYGSAPIPAEQAELELKQFDENIYRAARIMFDNMSSELKRLGVPFFGVKQELILPPGAEKPLDAEKSQSPGWGPKVTEEELLSLQRKMTQYLEDMYRS